MFVDYRNKFLVFKRDVQRRGNCCAGFFTLIKILEYQSKCRHCFLSEILKGLSPRSIFFLLIGILSEVCTAKVMKTSSQRTAGGEGGMLTYSIALSLSGTGGSGRNSSILYPKCCYTVSLRDRTQVKNWRGLILTAYCQNSESSVSVVL